ncbi:MAG: CHAT domain-containing protein [Cyanobacteria bacterium P01_F01_bin.150]
MGARRGKFVAGSPSESFLMLGDANPLSIQDIESLGADLDDVHLVVLSACETAVGGPDANGIEVAGISSYFLAANRASAVMASLWLVNDASTSLLMERFYSNLAQGTMTKAEALQQAQLSFLPTITTGSLPENTATLESTEHDGSQDRGAVEMRVDPDRVPEFNTPTPNLSHPYYWAPFILIGNGL